MANEDKMGWEEAIEKIMKYKGVSRNEATAQLVEKCRQGKIRTWGVRADTGESGPIPPEAWPKIN
jgi:hypothetical protein